MEFIGREEEQKAIDHLLNQKGYRGCIIYGRRRLGKSELVRHCLESKGSKVVFYQCKESNEFENTQLLSEVIMKTFGLSHLSFSSFFDALRFLFQLSEKEEVYLVLDEYPYIRDLIDGCDSKLQELIDFYANDSQLKFFLIGSSIAEMEDAMSKDRPLFGRFALSILLKQMDYYDSAKFYPSFSSEDKVTLYAVFGGVPFYNAQIDEGQGVKENIIRLLSGSYAGLRDFLEVYLKSELRKVNQANLVFDAIASGAFHHSDILAKSHTESSALLSIILQKLMKMDLIEYVCPINDKTNPKKSGYRISDHATRFYYRYLYRREEELQTLSDEGFYENFIQTDLESSYVPRLFETIGKEFLIRQNKAGKMEPALLSVGTYWYDNPIEKRNGQFDVVGKNKEGYVFFECKYTNSPMDDSQIEEEISQVRKAGLKPAGYGFISKNGFSLKKDYPYYFFTLDDVYR